MRRKSIALLSAACALVAAGRAQAAEVRAAVAANMQQVMTAALIPAFEKQTGDTVTATYGSTKALAQQIQNGAPIDVFVAADTATVAQLASAGLIDKASASVYAVGRLVLWTRADNPRRPRSIGDLADPAYARVAIADPDLAPYGKAAVDSLAKAGLLASVQPRIVQAGNIAEALSFAKSGNADVAFTALSLVIDDKADPYVVVPDKLHAPITQAAGLVTSSAGNPAARRFLDFLKSKTARRILTDYGYALPGRRMKVTDGTPATAGAARPPRA